VNASDSALDLGLGLTSVSRPTLDFAARCCADQARRIRGLEEQHVRCGHLPRDTVLFEAAAFDLAERVLKSLIGHESEIRALIAARRNHAS
jgi:hypothetical protein